MKKIILIILLIIIVWAVAAAATRNAPAINPGQNNGENNATTTPVNSGENAPPGSIHNLPVPTAVSAARAQLAKSLVISESKILIASAYERDWPNSCLGVERTGEMCLQVITPGYEVTMEANGKTYVYHTNADGSVIRVKK